MKAIIILNWNGWEDTIECIDSLFNAKGNYFIILVDNGSTDTSVDNIVDFFNKKDLNYNIILEGNNLNHFPSDREVILYKLNHNYGFARGNNMALELIKNYMPEWCLLLNNDTEVSPDFMLKLDDFICTHPQYLIVSPLIYYYYNKKVVWNAGGKIFWGLRFYNYANRSGDVINETESIKCTFITGCGLLFNRILLDNNGHIFTERFFHGEEDFDLSIRMNKAHIPMACVVDSVIYHKVNKSTAHIKSLGKQYVYYLNRFINIKYYLPTRSFLLWKGINIILIYIILKKNKVSYKKSYLFCKKLWKESSIMCGVNKDDFFNYVNNFPIRL